MLTAPHPITCACPICERLGCARPAAGFLALQLRCPDALLDDGEVAGAVLATIPTGPQLCDEHVAEAIAGASRNVAALVAELNASMPRPIFNDTAQLVLLPFDHPDVVRVRAGRACADQA